MSDETRREIGRRLRLAREDAGLTQGQAAKMLRLHRPAISEMEAGRRRVSADELQALCRLYQVSPQWVLEDRQEAPDAAVELAARKLANLKKEDLDSLMDLFRRVRASGVDNE